jgi:TRAP-type C4-dicarboxylate transport system permease small subunit
MGLAARRGRSGLSRAAAAVIDAWALLGGLTLLAVVAMNVASVVGGAVWVPFPGDFELTQIGVAVAAFAFLPYCELTGANVTADIFTAGAGRRVLAVFKLLASVVAFLFGLLLLWRMYGGLLDQKEYNYITAIVEFPIWVAFVPILISLALLATAAAITLGENARSVAGRP